ncbi:peptidase inhibitor I78 family protein [Novosphingobium sp. PhB165]|uniref:I78 family peptidase inhibitor n=1 Tax=Novosphingobium sp. PhB165 TaxID=2485105 RepID=UPI0010ECB7DC|nr:I78 family peptidase inhibitor [Novosphingobium sp. PhB165]TCM21954.1 peptidase inhibitor I78 family protein [Novosphingobium sp. PhB165]
MIRRSTTMTALTAGLLALSACSGTGAGTGKEKVAEAAPPPAPPPSMEPDCGADKLGSYVGQPASDEVIAAIAATRGDKPMRVIKPGMGVTMDYMPERLNVQVGEDGKIKGFNCT